VLLRLGKLDKIEQQMASASNYTDYHAACIAHDEASGKDKWKSQSKSNDYDYKLVQNRLTRIQQTRARHDIHGLISILHEGIHGNLGNIANPALYHHSKAGTKKLIEHFLDELHACLEDIFNAPNEVISFYEKLSFFEQTSHAYGQSCLMLSGGAGLGFFHCGVVRALLGEGLLPNVISGASAGSIITAMLGTRTDEELKTLLNAQSIYRYFKNWGKWKGLGSSSLLDSTNIENALIELFDITTFEQAWCKTGREINITVSPADLHQDARMLNNKTSPNAIITQAVRASCAIPYLFEPIQLKALNAQGEVVPYVPNRKFADGSIMADLPIQRLSRLYSVNHSIVSQTNPLAVPFLSRNRKKSSGLLSLTTRHLTTMVKQSSIYACDVFEEMVPTQTGKLGIHKIKSIIEQQYVGDINILPPRSMQNIQHLLVNPTIESIDTLIQNAEKATWPQLEMIKNTTRISRTFQRYVKLLQQEESSLLQG
jgi:predicted acylesterase/phospholipase RssA